MVLFYITFPNSFGQNFQRHHFLDGGRWISEEAKIRVLTATVKNGY